MTVTLTVDVAVLAPVDDRWHVLLVRRDRSPFAGRWAFPGGKVKPDELLPNAACRELDEEAGVLLSVEDMQPLDLYQEPGRDERGRHVSLLHIAVLPELVDVHAGSDAVEARWWPLDQSAPGIPSPLAFDHDTLLRDVRRVAPRSPAAQIRRIIARDVPSVVRLHHAALRAAGAHAGPGQWDDDLEDVQSVYVSSGGEFFVAELGPVIVGMGALRRIDDVTAELKRMRVLPRWQGRRVGRAVAEALVARAAELGFRRLVLDTTAEQTTAVALYRSLGFTQTGTAVVAGLASLLFEKSLNGAIGLRIRD